MKTAILYLSTWFLCQLVILFLPFVGVGVKAIDQYSLFFLISVPFAILSFVLKNLKPKYFYYFAPPSFVGMIIIYFISGNYGGEAWRIAYLKSTWSPVLGSLSILTFFYLLIGVGLVLRQSYDILSIRRSYKEESEQTDLFQLKQVVLPDAGLSLYKYKQLLKLGIGFVTTKENVIFSSVQSFVNADIFYFYDLVSDRSKLKDEIFNPNHPYPMEQFLLINIYKRPEIQSNKPTKIVYAAQEKDTIWNEFFLLNGFAFITKASPEAEEFLLGMDKLLQITIDDWSAFSSLQGFYMKNMEYPKLDTKKEVT